jgi:hypothetical protein
MILLSVALIALIALSDAYEPDALYENPPKESRMGVTPQGKLLASDAAGFAFFGYSVALSGETALVGAFGDYGYRGAAYVYVRSGDVWAEQAKLLAFDGVTNQYFGRAVALSGDTALVGAYADDDQGWISGSAHVFVRNGDVWTEQAKLLASDGAKEDWFGDAVALAGDTALVGASHDDDKGFSSGSVYVFVRAGDTWTEQAKLLASDGASTQWFGAAVAVSGETALVGAFNSNSDAAYVFVRGGGGVWTEQAKLVTSDGDAPGYFGRAVALSGDTALVGAPAEEGSVGGVYVFVRDRGVWTEQAKMVASDAAMGHEFGHSVALSGETALVGASGDDSEGQDAGSAYVFKRGGGVWSEQAKLVASDGAAGDFFGISLALSGDTVIVGAPQDDDDEIGLNFGSAHVYRIRPGGILCATGQECPGGSCVDGMCCDTDCGGGLSNDCQACSVAAGAEVDGICGPVTVDTVCRPAGECDAAERCDGVDPLCPPDVAEPDGLGCAGGVCIDRVCMPMDETGDPSTTGGESATGGQVTAGSATGDVPTDGSMPASGGSDGDSSTAGAGSASDGCGCRAGVGTGGWLALVLAGLAARRRRMRGARA